MTEVKHSHEDSQIGIDMRITRFATLSDGSYLEPRNSFKKHQEKLAREQRKFSKKMKFSQNGKKQKRKISGIHTTIANVRSDFLHQSSTKIIKNHGVVVIEDLKLTTPTTKVSGILGLSIQR